MWTGISWASTKASGSPASIAEPSSRPRETSISESWQMQNKPPKSKISESKLTNSKNSKDTLPWANICHFQTFSSCSHSPHIVCILEYIVIHISFHIMMILMKLSQAQINGAWGCEVRLWSVWCWVHSAGKSQKAQTLQTWAGNSCWKVSMLSNFFLTRSDGSATCASPHSRTKATCGDTSWQSTRAPPTTATSVQHSLATTAHYADIFSQNTRESGENLMKATCQTVINSHNFHCHPHHHQTNGYPKTSQVWLWPLRGSVQWCGKPETTQVDKARGCEVQLWPVRCRIQWTGQLEKTQAD